VPGLLFGFRKKKGLTSFSRCEAFFIHFFAHPWTLLLIGRRLIITLRDNWWAFEYLINFLHLFFAQQATFYRLNILSYLGDGLEARDRDSPIVVSPYPGDGNLSQSSCFASVSEKFSYCLNPLEELRCLLIA